MKKVKLSQIGNSTGIVLPKEALAKMNVSKGDTLYLVETPDGYALTPYEDDFEHQMEVAEDVMKRFRNTLRRLGK
jgi:putative addiction module antidote